MRDIAEDDVFTDSTIPVVDCDVLEASKENVQPLASGRRATALAKVFTTPHAQREVQLKMVRARLRRDVEHALESSEDNDDSDALEAYCRFVNWTLENYPQGHTSESGLLELLEEATRVLKDDGNGRWRGELKYLKLWVLYASFVERPTIIYQFMLANEIGTDHAIFYEEYATVLERDGSRTAADEVYLLGIARRAFPVERLQAKHAEFQKRMMLSTTASSDGVSGITSSSSLASVSAERAARRPALATTASSIPTPPQAGSSATRTTANNAGRLQIFVDPDTSSSGSPFADPAPGSSTPWPELGTRRVRIKENIPEVRTAAGTTLRRGTGRHVSSGSTSSRSKGPKIEVYRDQGPDDPAIRSPPEPTSQKNDKVPSKIKSSIVPFIDEDESEATTTPAIPATPRFTPFRDETATPSSAVAIMPDSVMKTKAAEAEALRKDPLKNYSDTDVH